MGRAELGVMVDACGAYPLMPAVATASAHKGMSAAIVAANSRGLLPMGSAP
jgi:hypothetical protein